jgi:hypothetical protein
MSETQSTLSFQPGDLVLWKPLMGTSRDRVKTAVVLDALDDASPSKVQILIDGQRKWAWEEQLRLLNATHTTEQADAE